MPSQMPSSFASAAAGQSSNRDARGNGRGDTRGSGDWSRKDNRSANGTLTLRRSSTTPHNAAAQQSASSDQASPVPSSDAVFGQAQVYSNESPTDTRYSKNAILEVFKARQSSGEPSADVTKLFVNNWDPGHSNGSTGRGWGKTNDNRDHGHGPEVCWDHNGQFSPLSLEEMSSLEKSLFADVNSPMKAPPSNREQNTPGSANNARRLSISHGQGGGGAFGLSSPTSSRPGTRRRETSDSVPYSSLASPGGSGRFNRDEISPFFSRKLNDIKDGPFASEGAEDTSNGTPKSNLPFSGMRSNTTGTGLGGPSSPWGAAQASATMSPMGNFGSFALGGNSAQPSTSEKRPGFGSMRGESRLAHLMPKESSEDLSKASDASKSWRSRAQANTDPFGDDFSTGGSAVLGGGQDTSPSIQQQLRAPGSDTPTRLSSTDPGTLDLRGPQTTRDNGPESPSELHSNVADQSSHRGDTDDGNTDGDAMHYMRGQALGGIPEHSFNNPGTLPRGFASGQFDGSDRSQTSSAGASRGFPPLGALSGLGGLGGWPTSANPIGTPDRERQGFQGAFGNPIFGPMGDLQSTNLGNVGGPFGSGATGNIGATNAIGRGSKLGSLFPAAMQAQMQGGDNIDHSGDTGEQRQNNAFGAIGRNAFGPSRDTDSPMRAGRGAFEDLFPPTGHNYSSGEQSQNPTAGQGPFSQGQGYQPSQVSSDSASNQLPQTQQRTMVMPDRMRWVYLDPQGQTQGPWSGLEMHDWYKASFFTPDLSVKKVEDNEFEPLGQLIRRIGNSREPFLVPQIGVPHGPPTTQAGAPFAPAATASGVPLATPGSVQPPFAGAFPSFGTTLTAEQQNNLERRKQEEQYLMARQREFLAQQQVNMKQLQMQGGIPAVLHHQQSTHSLHSQPSFGSMTSPSGMALGGQIAGGQGNFFDSARQAGGPPVDYFREEELARLGIHDRQPPFGGLPPTSQGQQFPLMFSHQADAQREASKIEQLRQNDPRVREFEQFRAQIDHEEAMQQQPTSISSDPIGPPHLQQPQSFTNPLEVSEDKEVEEDEPESLSLTQQVQKAASSKHSPATAPESPWAKVGAGLPMPFPPPPQSTSPLPAPMAQRGRSNLPEALNMESRSRSETPEIFAGPPSVAPWAKEPAEAPKGPSLKEIQEAEAIKAAKKEEAAVAARRALFEQELRIQPVVPAPGLPSSSTWGTSSAPPASASVVASAWAKATANKVQTPVSATAASKKTLADIQREEETRKAKIAAATAATTPVGLVAGGKRYADLASKSTAGPATGGAWSTVGSGGKVKIPTGPATSTPSPIARAASSAAIPTAAAVKIVRPTVAPRSTTAASAAQSGVVAAQQELLKWAKNALGKALSANINVDDFVQMLSEFPPEVELISDSVYANSQLLDGRRFAEEFLRRKRLAEKGVIENSSSMGFSTANDSSATGGWNEVAKKGPAKPDEPAGNFKVVPSKKKGRK